MAALYMQMKEKPQKLSLLYCTFGWNPVNRETFLLLNCGLRYIPLDYPRAILIAHVISDTHHYGIYHVRQIKKATIKTTFTC